MPRRKKIPPPTFEELEALTSPIFYCTITHLTAYSFAASAFVVVLTLKSGTNNPHLGSDGQSIRPILVLRYFQHFPPSAILARDIRIPTEPIPPIPYLPVYSNSLQCQVGECRFPGTDLHRMQLHYRQSHDPKASFRSPLTRRPPCTKSSHSGLSPEGLGLGGLS
jgi:hypothetical protein